MLMDKTNVCLFSQTKAVSQYNLFTSEKETTLYLIFHFALSLSLPLCFDPSRLFSLAELGLI